MKSNSAKILLLLLPFFPFAAGAQNPDLVCTFHAAEIACLEQHILVTYTGNAPETATYDWNFGDAQVLSGSGQGPYYIRWLTTGEKTVSLFVSLEGQTCTYSRQVIIRQWPTVFAMTGGGTYPPGGAGVHVGLSGSQQAVIYTLFRGDVNTGITLVGNGEPLDFGLITEPGTYTCKARWDGSECGRFMEGSAIVSTGPNLNDNFLCMVTYDTVSSHNLVVMYKPETTFISQYNIYRETWQNNVFEKVGELPYSSFAVWSDPNSFPLVRSYRYKVSAVDINQHEYEKCPAHKTIHLNIVPGLECYNLIWNHYEGFEYLTYRIHRRINDGSYEVIDSVASNVNSYTDYSVGGGLATYYIEVLKPHPCHPWKSGGAYESVVSNVAAAVPYGVEESSMEGLQIAPNPVKDLLYIRMKESTAGTTYCTLLSMQGMVCGGDTFEGARHTVDLRFLKAGMYIMEVRNSAGVARMKFLKQ